MTILGTTLLSLVLALSLGGAFAWAGAAREAAPSRQPALARAGRWAIALAFAATAAAVVLVESALLRHDTTLNYVAKVTGPEVPVYYRITALWSALEGSLLLWLFILTAVAALAMRHSRSADAPGAVDPPRAVGSTRAGDAPRAVGSRRADAVAGTVLSISIAAFAVVVLMASPFTVPDAAVTARPSPLLQDHVAMGIHPPLLYGGFLALAVPYALAISGLVTGELGASWADRIRRWSLSAWILLTAGIVLGGWWSYAVLGWGGYWAWDPVENASLLPWLITTALLHAVAPRARAGAWRLWAAGLAGAGFILVLLATFLTRSGVVESIHAFTTSSIGPALLAIMLAALVPWAVLLHRRRVDLGDPTTSPLLSRATVLRLNRILLVLVTLVVLVGTLLPSILQAVTGERLSVGPPWYHRTLAPIALVLLVAMAVGPWLPLRGVPWRTLVHRVRLPALAGAVMLGVVALASSEVWLAISAGIAVFALASLVLVSSRRRRRDRLAVGAWIAHTGMAVAAVAVLGGGLGTVSQQSVPVGGTVTAGTTTATVLDLEGRDEGRRSVAAATVAIGEGQEFVAIAQPELRWYEAERTMLAGPEIRSELLRDVYVTLLDYDEQEALVTIRLAVNPLVSWIWASTALMILGAVVAGWPRRRRRARAGRSDRRPDRAPGQQPEPAAPRVAQETGR